LRCIANPLFDDTASKSATRQVLAAIHRVLSEEIPTIAGTRQELPVRIQQSSRLKCGFCGASLLPGARFCSNCGEKQEN
jgi:hypothetical protein